MSPAVFPILRFHPGAYCAESGVSYESANNAYTSQNGTNSSYFKNLTDTAQYGIMLATVYGWEPERGTPVSGTNNDDYALATQVIIWEYQQQLRTSPYDLHTNSYGVRADNYLRTIQVSVIVSSSRTLNG